MALYSTSPPPPVTFGHFTAHCSSSAHEPESLWLQPGVSTTSRHSRGGGLSHLFATSNSNCAITDSLDSSGLSSASVLRNSSQMMVDHVKWESGDVRSMNISGSFGRSWERSPISILQSPYTSHGSSSSSSCFFSVGGRSESPVCQEVVADRTWRHSRAPVFRSEGFEVGRSLRAEAALMCGQVETCSSSSSDEKRMTAALAEILSQATPPPFEFVRRRYLSPDEILADAQARHKVFKDPFIIKAFRLAEEAHQDSFRRSGELYLTHCVETAILLALAGAEATVVAAGLLHDTLDDSNTDEAQIRAVFGDDVTDLVVGVSKISQLSQLARDNNIASKTLEADRLRTMFLAMVDVRVVLIKLADRLHNMRTLQALPGEKQIRVANETLEILVPIANRLGIWSWKAEMEDLCFKFLKPAEYQGLATKLSECCRGGVVLSAIEQLEKALSSNGIAFEDLNGRSKNLFSIYTKMRKKGRSIDEIHDVRGLRLVVKNERACYDALEVVHKLWQHIPGKLKDYIGQPKTNGYQSLHTVVTGKDGLPLEVQIRTKEMHRHAEFGMAAHWRYKEGNDRHSTFLLQRVEWARWVLTWHSELMDTKLRVSPSHMDLKSSCPFPFHKSDCPHALVSEPPASDDDPLFVIMLKGEKMIVQELPSGCTAADLIQKNVEQLLTDEMDHEKQMEMTPKVNHQLVQNFEQKLRMGDVVEIVQECPESSTVYVTMARVPGKEELSSYREQMLRMYAGDRSCKMDARKSFTMVKENTQIAGLT